MRLHRVVGRLVWSRGHSFESYLFEPDLFGQVLEDLTPRGVGRAARRTRALFQQCLHLACSIGLAGQKLGLATRISRTINWRCVIVSDDAVALDMGVWRGELCAKHRMNEAVADALVRATDSARRVVSQADSDAVRWACHGHIGMAVIWAAFARCAFEAVADASEAQATAEQCMSASEAVRTSALIGGWCRAAVLGQVVYPKEVFQLLRLEHEAGDADNGCRSAPPR
jgi:hypothetical protein